MTVAELAEALPRKAPAGWALTWITEQELRDGAGAAWFPACHTGSYVPDGVLVGRRQHDGGMQRIIVEVELHAKPALRYAPKLAWYARLLRSGVVQRVRWYVPSQGVAAAVERALVDAGLAIPTEADVRLLDQATIPVYGSARLSHVA